MVFMFAIMNDLPNAYLAEAISYLISYHPHGKALRCSPKQWHFKRKGRLREKLTHILSHPSHKSEDFDLRWPLTQSQPSQFAHPPSGVMPVKLAGDVIFPSG